MMKFLLLFFFIFIIEAESACNNVFLIFVGNTKSDYKNVSISDQSGVRGTPGLFAPTYTKYYDPSKKTMIYFTGWRSNYNSEDTDAMINAFLTRKATHNIIWVDWYFYTNNFAYVTSLGAINGVSLNIYFCQIF
jgi:hypothetical protein